MNLLVPTFFLFFGFFLMVLDLVFIEKKSLSEILITMQFLLPKGTLGLIGNIIVIVSAAVLVYLKVMAL